MSIHRDKDGSEGGSDDDEEENGDESGGGDEAPAVDLSAFTAPKAEKVHVELFEAEEAAVPSENARMFGDVTDANLKKACKKMYKLLNLDPWNEKTRYDDDDTCDFLIDNPEVCGIKYEFEGFSGRIYPLSMLCALGASKDAVELAFDAFPPALKETDLWVGTPLHYAAAYQAPHDVVEYLIQKDPKGVESTNYYGRLPLHMGALFKASEKSMTHLLKAFPKGAQVKDKEGYTALHLACENGADSGVIKALVQTFPDAVHATAQYDMTPLHFACSSQANPEVIKVLLVEGDTAICRLTDMLGHTPLHMALMGLASYEVVELLVASAPDTVIAKTQKGELPLEIAQRKRAPGEVLELLEKMIEKLLSGE